MAMPFATTDAAATAQLANAPGLNDLDRLAIGDIAALPPDMLLTQRYEAAAATERAAQGKTSGTVRIEDGGITVIADLPKKVSWDQDRLAAMAARIAASGDDPTQYLEIAYRVPERRFGAWPEAMREGFASARSETTGKPVFRLETRDR